MARNNKHDAPPLKPTTLPARWRRGAALNVGLAVLVGGALVWASLESSGGFRKRPRRLDPVNSLELQTVLRKASLDPESLAAAGLSPQQASMVASDAAAYVNANVSTLRAIEATLGEDKAEVDRLQRVVQSGQGGPEDIQALSAAATRLAGSTAQRQAALDDLFAAGLARASEGQRAKVASIRSHRGWDLPTQYLVHESSDADFARLRGALADDRISTGLGNSPNPGAHQLLLTWNGQTDVAAAAEGMANLPDVNSAWLQALQP